MAWDEETGSSCVRVWSHARVCVRLYQHVHTHARAGHGDSVLFVLTAVMGVGME